MYAAVNDVEAGNGGSSQPKYGIPLDDTVDVVIRNGFVRKVRPRPAPRP